MSKHFRQPIDATHFAPYSGGGNLFSRHYFLGTNDNCGYASSGNGTFGKLEKLAFKYFAGLKGQSGVPQMIEIGCGAGDLAAELVEKCHISAILVDRAFSLGDKARALHAAGRLRLIIKPAENLYLKEIPAGLSGLIAQRSLHWLPWKQANGLLRRVGSRMLPGAKVFISLADIAGELGKGYPFTTETPLGQRYAISQTGDPAYRHPVTLYAAREALNLVTENGFRLNEVSRTNWGLHVITATRTDEPMIKKQDRYRQTRAPR